MKKGFRSLVTLLLLVTLALSTVTTGALAASAPEATLKDANVNQPGTFPIVKEPITLRVGLVQSPHVENYETNALTNGTFRKGRPGR